jgi:thymidine kinase
MSGRIEVITGPMFSGKTEELVRRVRRAHFGRYNTQLFQPRTNTRTSRSLATMLPETVIHSVPTGSNLTDCVAPDVSLVAVDEAQFFQENSFLTEIQSLVDRGVTVVIAGLDMDFRGRPFGLMPQLMAIADEVLKLTAVCFKCRRAAANRTYRIPKPNMSTAQIVVGDVDEYEARCRACFSEAT